MKRHMWAGVALVLASFESFAAPGPREAITEADAVRTFLGDSPQARLVGLQEAAVRAESSIGSEAGNPALTYQIEDAAGVRDEFLTFQQELPITGRRSLLRERADAASSAAELYGLRDLQNATFDLRIAFYDVIYRDSVVSTLVGSDEELNRIVEALRAREQEGEGSGYDVIRAEQESTELQLEIVRAESESAAARARFGSFFDQSREMESAAIVGDLSQTEPMGSEEDAIEIALAERADLKALRQDARKREIGLEAARRQRFPEPVLSAGWKRVEALDESDTGFMASLMVPIPVFDRGNHESARAQAMTALVGEHEEMLRRKIRAEVKAAHARAVTSLRAAEQLGAPVQRRAVELRRISRLSYEEGEMGILELLDAFRTSLEMEIQALASRHEAKTARIELNRMTGREAHP